MLASPPPQLDALVRVAHVQDGRAIIPARCTASGCRGTVRGGAEVRRVRLRAGQTIVLTVPVRARARQVRLTVRLRHAAVAHPTLTVIRRPDHGTCGYAPLARTLARAPGAQLLRVLDRDAVGTRLSRIVACRDGRATEVAQTIDEAGFSGQVALAASVSAQWAAVAVTAFDHYGGDDRRVCVARLSDGHTSSWPYDFDYESTGYPQTLTLAMTDPGAILIGQSTPASNQIRVIDDARDRVLDDGADIDPATLAVDGTSAVWSRAGVPRRVTVGDSPVELGTSADPCPATSP